MEHAFKSLQLGAGGHVNPTARPQGIYKNAWPTSSSKCNSTFHQCESKLASKLDDELRAFAPVSLGSAITPTRQQR